MQVNKDYTFEQLKANFKRLVLEYHPDRKQKLDDSIIFQTLKFSYDYLLERLKSKGTDKTHQEFKLGAKREGESLTSGKQNVNVSTGDKFNLEQFNRLFAESRIGEAYDDGYANWTEDTPRGENAIVAYKDPEPMFGGRFSSAYELGRTAVGDFSGDNMGSGLKYMDFRLAHTTTALVNPKVVETRTEFKSIEDMKKHRSNIQFVPTAGDIEREHLKKLEDEKKEKQRQEAVKQKDSLIDQIYNKTHKIMIAAFGS